MSVKGKVQCWLMDPLWMGEIREASNEEKPHLQVLSTQENSAPDNCIQGDIIICSAPLVPRIKQLNQHWIQ